MELVVVIAVIIVLAAISIPAFSTMFKGRALRDGARIVQMAFMHGRLQAMTRNRPVMVRLVPFTKTESGKDIATDGTKLTTEVRWKIEMVDADGDGDYVTDENLDNLDFCPDWMSTLSFTNPDPGQIPNLDPAKVAIRGEVGAGVWHGHAVGDPEDDKVIESFEFPDKIYPRIGRNVVGSDWGQSAAVFIFAANGSCRIQTPDLSTIISNCVTGDPLTGGFKKLDSDGRPELFDFRIEDPINGESAYLDIVPMTGIVNIVFAVSP